MICNLDLGSGVTHAVTNCHALSYSIRDKMKAVDIIRQLNLGLYKAFVALVLNKELFRFYYMVKKAWDGFY